MAMARATAAETANSIDTLQGMIQKGVRLFLTREWMSPQEAISPNRSDVAAAA